MNKIAAFFLCLFTVTVAGFAEDLTLKNQTPYPKKNGSSKIAVQWADSGREVDEGNKAMMHDLKLNSDKIQVLGQPGTVTLSIPEHAEYFRVLVWTKDQENPDLLTNWVEVTPNKTYTLKADHLAPSVLMLGTGC